MTKEEFKQQFMLLSAAYPHSEVNSFSTKMYWNMFKDVPVEHFKGALEMAISEADFFPSVAKIRKYLDKTTGKLSVEQVFGIIDEIKKKCWNGESRASKNIRRLSVILSENVGIYRLLCRCLPMLSITQS